MSARELITEHLDLWTGAVTKKSSSGRGSNGKVELTGVKKLRELILDLALKGRLSERFIDDQPAEKLIEQFFLHKEKLVKDGELRRQKKLPEITYQEHEYKIPETWQVERLARLSHQITKGTTPTSIGLSFAEKGVNFVKVESLHDGGINHANVQFISQDTHQALQRSQLEAGDILFSIAGTIGKTAIVQDIDTPANTNQALAIIKGTSQVFTERFLKLQLDSFVSAKAKNKARGGAMSNISLGDLSNLVVIVPPIEEQHRIVQKVDELMALCDRLEQQTSDQLEAHETLVDTLLGTLTQSANATELAENWARLAEYFDTLFTTEQSIDKLKQTILQLAVMGRLVEQDDGDEPAEQLIERIATHKAETGNGKRRASKPPKSGTAESQPFQIPSTWAWMPLRQTGITSTGKTPSTKNASFFSGDIPFIGPGQVTAAGKINTPEKYLSEEGILQSEEALSGDILTVCIGGSIGKTAIVTERCGFNQQLNKIRPVLVEPSYLLAAINADFFQHSIREKATGSATPIINRSKWESIAIPLAPLDEQRRIVQKVDELMALCDHLKQRLTQASNTRCQLAGAVVEGALN
ncbi:MAG: restriction endonuclease subunit S [Halomonas meridiana]|uniref:restriction endonuclease subunit S n=1 Tax=Vreelandella aquamarina TaxID=77097 RepID=UPI0024E1AB22|nr:restriction endonuclease subunit S [Halomonas meridiana]MDK2750080.1 restriction endonuclease subunit S [Halomonas meridiana]